MYSFQDLQYFMAVADLGSIRAAATSVHRTQPAVTVAIRRLEQAVGFTLLDRSAYRAKLTAQGAIFADGVRPVLRRIHELKELNKLLVKGNEPRIRLAFDSAVPRAALMELVARAVARFPGVSIELEELEGSAPMRRLEDRVAAMAIVYDVALERRFITLEKQRLGASEFGTFALAESTEPGGAPKTGLAQIVVADFEIEHGRFDRADSRNLVSVNSHRLQAEAILAGIGWGTGPVDMLASEVERGRVLLINRGGASTKRLEPYSLFRLQEAAHGPVVQFIWTLAAEMNHANRGDAIMISLEPTR